MKKLYTLALAALCACLSAGAASRTLSTDITIPAKSQFNRPAPVKKLALPDNLRKAAAADEEEPSSIFGDYEWYYMDYASGYDGQSAAQIFPSEVEQDSIVIFFDYDFGVVAGYDEASGSVSIPSGQFVGAFNTSQGVIETYFYHAELSEDGTKYSIVDTPVEAVFDGYGIEFDPRDLLLFGNAELNGWFIFAGDNYLLLTVDDWVDEMPAEGWVFHSYSTLVDAWLMSGIAGIDPAELPYDVLVERNEDVDGLYRIVNPYGDSSPLYDMNMNLSGTGYIVFSVADPDFVTVQPWVYSGMNDGYDQYLCTNIEGFYSVLQGYTKEEIIASGFLNGISSYDADAHKVTFCNAGFSTKTAPDELYDWGEMQTDGSLTFSAYTGVNSVAVEGEGAPEYYNLQGLRIDNPADGQVLIKKQGGKAVKVRIVR